MRSKSTSTSRSAHVCLGMVSNGSGQYAEARAAYKKALESDEFSDEGLLGLALPKNTWATSTRQNERTDVQWNAGRTTGPAARGSRTSIGIRAATKRPPSSSSKPSSSHPTTRAPGRHSVPIISLWAATQTPSTTYRRSLALAPTFNAYQALGMTYYRMRRFDDAITVFEQARRLSDQYRGPGSLARVYYWQGRNAEARALFDVAIEGLEQALQVNPNDVNAHLLLAEFQAKLGHQTEATAQLLAAGDVSGDPHKLLFGAIVHNHLGNRAAALEWLEKASRKGLPKAELLASDRVRQSSQRPTVPGPRRRPVGRNSSLVEFQQEVDMTATESANGQGSRSQRTPRRRQEESRPPHCQNSGRAPAAESNAGGPQQMVPVRAMV